MTIQAHGENYFGPGNFPIFVNRPRMEAPVEVDEHDLTEIPHYHDFSELVVVVSGTGVHWVEGEEYAVRAGDVFLFQGELAIFDRR